MEVKEESGRAGRSGGGEMSSRICQLLMIHMTGGAPFGFRITPMHANGRSPFAVSMIRLNGKASRAGLLEKDFVLAINGFSSCNGITHQSATRLMEYDEPELTLHILRGEGICEDDIRNSLQSLDSQILVLTDEEVTSVVAKKQSQQTIRSPLSRSAHLNNGSCQASPFRLQPPPQTRAKLMERRKDRQQIAPPLKQDYTQQNGLISNVAFEESRNAEKVRFSDEANEEPLQTSIHGTPFTGTAISDELNTSTEVKDHYTESNFNKQNQPTGSSREFGQFREFNDRIFTENTKTAPQSKPSGAILEQGSFLATNSERLTGNDDASRRTEAEAGVRQQQQQQPLTATNGGQLRDRYRVEQKMEFKPVQQTRYYDAESGQFRENAIAGVPSKRRSNSISSYHMYISPGGMKPAPQPVDNRSLFHSQVTNFNPWQASTVNGRQLDTRVADMANAPASQQNNFTQNSINPSAASCSGVEGKQAPWLLSSSHTLQRTQDLSSFNASNPLSREAFDSVQKAKWSPTYPQPPPTADRVPMSSQWDSGIHQSPSLHHLSPTVHPPVTPSNIYQVQSPVSPLARGFIGKSSSPAPISCYQTSQGRPSTPLCRPSTPQDRPSTPGTEKVMPRLIRLRSETEDGARNERHERQTDVVRAFSSNPPGHIGEIGRVSRGVRPMSARTYGSPRQAEPETSPTKSYHQRTEKTSRNSPLMTGPQLAENIALNEGRGGRLFARRRANSEAWIVGERNDAAAAAAAARPSVQDTTAYGKDFEEVTASNSGAVPVRRRRSFMAGHQQPIQNEMTSINPQYRSTTAQRLNSATQPFNFAGSPQSGSHPSNVRTAVPPNVWQPQRTTMTIGQPQQTMTIGQPSERTLGGQGMGSENRYQATEDFALRHGNVPRNLGYTDL